MLEDIRNNIARLISRYEEQRQRADSLAAKLSELEGEVRKYRKQITELNQQIDNLRLLSAFMADPDPKDARARVDSLIKEIDRCIGLLEN